MFNYATTSQTVTKCFKDVFTLYKQSFKKLLPLLFVSSLLIPLPMVMLIAFHWPLPKHASTEPVLIIAQITVALIGQYLMTAALYMTHSIANGKPVSVITALRFTNSKYLPVIAAAFVCAMFVFFGELAYVVPGIFLKGLLLFSGPLIILDDCNVMDSIKESAGLVWGNWWRTFAVVLLPFIIATVILLGSSFLLLKLTHMFIVAWVFFVITGTILGFFVYCAYLVQFNDLKHIKSRKNAADTDPKLEGLAAR